MSGSWKRRTCSLRAVGRREIKNQKLRSFKWKTDVTATMMEDFLIPKVGILAVQGDFTAHAEMLQALGAETVEVRAVADLESCDALVLPGGESTTQLQFLQEEGLFEAIKRFAENRQPIFGTCAGAILLAKTVQHPAQESLGLLDMTVTRNAYGRQMAS